MDPEIDQHAGESMWRPYRNVISGDPEQGFLIEVPDLPGCMTAGETEAEAVALLPEAMAAWLTVALESGAPIPEPTPEPAYSGRFLLRVPKTLHRRLAERAELEGVSLNQWMATLLAEGMGRPDLLPGGEDYRVSLGIPAGPVEEHAPVLVDDEP